MGRRVTAAMLGQSCDQQAATMLCMSILGSEPLISTLPSSKHLSPCEGLLWE